MANVENSMKQEVNAKIIGVQMCLDLGNFG
jgi:hypothetical protein